MLRRREILGATIGAAIGAMLPARARAGKKPVRVALYKAGGVHPVAFAAAKQLLEKHEGFRLRVTVPQDIRGGSLGDEDVVVFMGGSGTAQGRNLGDDGKQRVKDFVAGGGGYVGVCAGAYMALQGEDQFHKLRIVAGRNLTGDFWQRGIAGLDVSAPGRAPFKLFFANGPIFTPVEVEGLAPYVSLAKFEGEIYNASKGTGPGEMLGTPAITASQFGKGRVLLFSPNPILGGQGVVQEELMLSGLRWVATAGDVGPGVGFADVFG
ncbi:BPL-N domain-containing protein [Nannocystis bainbridge]|uniref:BPL-N domain-containing protein n=1 Tax=Nannocystis bainbridge TaxID=2995303 RepID=A0ABT5EDG4_9BACT|nr:BPL-N domain-containing protein [Nannocystis bainbridge]MDC0723354.1 BPL-N domain-containing protein [Nannocystis bainbridge]